MAGFTAVVGYFLLTARKRKIPLQYYLIQLRVGAQAVAVGTLSAGAIYMFFKDRDKKNKKD